MKSHTEITAIRYKLKHLNENLDKDYQNGIPSNVKKSLCEIKKAVEEVIDHQSTCKYCKGSGLIIDFTTPSDYSSNGFLSKKCNHCNGTGAV